MAGKKVDKDDEKNKPVGAMSQQRGMRVREALTTDERIILGLALDMAKGQWLRDAASASADGQARVAAKFQQQAEIAELLFSELDP